MPYHETENELNLYKQYILFSNYTTMARNTLAWTKKWKSNSAKYYQSNPEAKAKKIEYDKKYQKTPSRVKYRTELNNANRKAGTYWNKDGKDMSHSTNWKLVKEKQSTNRARQWANGKSTKKPVKKKK